MKVSCPHCKADAQWEGNQHRPFCSERCRSTDLGNWATERYRIGTTEHDERLDVDATKKSGEE